MKAHSTKSQKELLAIKVHQWLDNWNNVVFDEKQYRRKPDPYFYMFTLSATELKSLAGIYRRPTTDGLHRESDLNIQRRHNKDRSLEIRRFVELGYPLSGEKSSSEQSQELKSLYKPGWLPTSVVINILTPDDKRRNNAVDPDDLVFINDIDDKTAKILLPKSFKEKHWQPSTIHPIEIIDGQHRLWAFEGGEVKGNFELPVVAFYGLDISWQAYLFWVINIKPKRINMSLAFDLYPLLRTEDWLEKFEGPKIYRETRAQEITEALWAYPKSAWYQRIDMLGEHRQTMVSQAAWINSLLNTFIKSWEGRGVRIGGLYGAPVGKDYLVLGWSRSQQVAFLITVWNKLREAVNLGKFEWAEAIRANKARSLFGDDPAFSGSSTLLNTDQGVRGVLHIVNDLCFSKTISGELPLHEWKFDEYYESEPETNAIEKKLLDKAMKSLAEENDVIDFITSLTTRIAEFDWRSASLESLSDEEKTAKLVFRGSGGYRELRRQLLRHLMKEGDDISKTAEDVYKFIGFES